jgi:hypothetical protein
MPTRPLQHSLSTPPSVLTTQVQQLAAAVKPVGTAKVRIGGNGTPLQVISCSATEKSGTVTVSFRRAADKNFASVRVWLIGYLKNPQPQLLASGVTSPIHFPCTVTGESVRVVVQTVGPTGATSDLTAGTGCTVKFT